MNIYDQTNPVVFSRDEVSALRADIEGPVSLPGEADYERDCASFNLLTSLRPAIVIGATSVADVQAAVRFAYRRNMPVAVLATGHHIVRPADRAILINMSRMNDVRVVADRRLARAEGGSRWQQVLQESDKHGLAPLCGSSGTVGVVGYHLGGGQSPVLGRKYGYASDQVHLIEVVTPNGEFHKISSAAHSDLFWALLGGKSNFGVVTAIEFALFPVSHLYGGGIFYSGENAPQLLHVWREWVGLLPDEMSSSLAFLRLPDLPMVPEPLRGKFVVHFRFTSLGQKDPAEQFLAPIRAIAPAIVDTIGDMPYRDLPSIFKDPPEPLPWVERSAMFREFPAEAANALLATAGPDSECDLGMIELRALGGALQQPSTANAVAGRTAAWQFFAAGGGRLEMIPLFQDQLAKLMQTMAPWSQDEITLNVISAAQGRTEGEIRAVYGQERYNRLAAIKAQYDPRNLFRINHNIVPKRAIGEVS
jgi:FAD/FMN-containing dehydrogenase